MYVPVQSVAPNKYQWVMDPMRKFRSNVGMPAVCSASPIYFYVNASRGTEEASKLFHYIVIENMHCQLHEVVSLRNQKATVTPQG